MKAKQNQTQVTAIPMDGDRLKWMLEAHRKNHPGGGGTLQGDGRAGYATDGIHAMSDFQSAVLFMFGAITILLGIFVPRLDHQLKRIADALENKQ